MTLSPSVLARKISVPTVAMPRRVPVEDKPLAINRSFQAFLESKKQTGFGARDFLQSRYVAFHTSKTILEKIKNFFLLGALGYLFTNVIKDENGIVTNINTLKAETDFYKVCIKTQNFYNKFTRKPANHFKAASEAFEKLHVFQDQLDELEENACHKLINEVLAKQVGSDVPEKLLEYFVREQLIANGGFSAVNLKLFYLKDNYVKTVLQKEGDGYGHAGIDEDGNIIPAKDPKSVRMIFARAVDKVLGPREQIEARAKRDTVVLQTFGGLNSEVSSVAFDGHEQAFRNECNQQLLESIISGNVTDEQTKLQQIISHKLIDKGAIKDFLHLTYVGYQENLTEGSRLEKLINDYRNQNQNLSNLLEGAKNELVECSYATLQPALGDRRKLPLGFRGYGYLRNQVTQLEGQIKSLQKKQGRADTVIRQANQADIEGLQDEVDQKADAAYQARADLYAQAGTRNNARDQFQALFKAIPTVSVTFIAASSENAIDTKKAEALIKASGAQKIYHNEQNQYEKLEKALSEKEAALQKAQNKLETRQKSIEQAIEKQKKSFQSQIDQKNQELAQVKSTTIKVSGASIFAAKDIIKDVADLREIAERIERKEEALQGNIQALHNAEDGLIRLEGPGGLFKAQMRVFGYNPETKTLDYPGFKEPGFTAYVKGHLLENRKKAAEYMIVDRKDLLPKTATRELDMVADLRARGKEEEI